MPRRLDPIGAVRVGPQQSKAEFDRGEVAFVDVRGRGDYEQSHIPGALSIPMKELMRRAGEIPVGRPITFY